MAPLFDIGDRVSYNYGFPGKHRSARATIVGTIRYGMALYYVVLTDDGKQHDWREAWIER